MMKLFIQFWLLSLCCLCSQAQQVFTGTVKDLQNNPVAGATIMLKNGQGLILKYALSDNRGKYRFSVADSVNLQPLFIEMKHISYKPVSFSIQKGKYVYDFIVEEQAQELDQVIVRQPPISQRGDTTRYNVAAFAQEEDRSIADVIKRMPGIDVDESGKISFNGKEIANLYIQGDDLMDGRYGAATKTIRKEMIENVDLIQNHQPIEVLRNKKLSDAVSMNLVLKDENSLAMSGEAMAGAGLPEQYTFHLNTVLLNEKIKTLNTLKANNSGEDYRNEINRMGGMIQNALSSSNSNLLSAGTVGSPNIPRRNYYLNRSGLANINYLFKNEKNIQFRTNIQAFTDRQTLTYNNHTTLYTATDTIRYTELQDIKQSPWLLNGSFSIMANKKNYFFNNRLSVIVEGGDEKNYLATHESSFEQNLYHRYVSIGNALHYTPALKGRNIIELSWSFNYSRQPEHLLIDEGLHEDILHNNIPYAAIQQKTRVPVLQNFLSANYLIHKEGFRQQYSMTFLQEDKQLNSVLELKQTNDQWIAYTGDAGNMLQWNRYRAVLTADYSWVRTNVYEVSVTIPVTIQSIHYAQQEYSLDEKQQRWWLAPSLNLKWHVASEDFLSLSYGYSNTIADMNSVYRGLILTNYRSLQANDAGLQEIQAHQAAIRYNYQRASKMLFLNGGVVFSKSSVNSLLSSVLNDNIQQTILLPVSNTRENVQFNLGASKYFYFLRSTISFKTAYNDSRMQQLVNDEMIPVKFHTLTGSLGWESRLFNRLNFNYTGNMSYNTMRQDLKTSTTTNMYRIDQQFNISFSLLKMFLFQVQLRNIYSQNKGGTDIQYWFTDAKIRHTLKKLNADIELDCTNLANINTYELFRVNAGISSVSSYNIRGRMALLKFTFNL